MSAETKAQLAEVKREIKAFEKLLASYGAQEPVERDAMSWSKHGAIWDEGTTEDRLLDARRSVQGFATAWHLAEQLPWWWRWTAFLAVALGGSP